MYDALYERARGRGDGNKDLIRIVIADKTLKIFHGSDDRHATHTLAALPRIVVCKTDRDNIAALFALHFFHDFAARDARADDYDAVLRPDEFTQTGLQRHRCRPAKQTPCLGRIADGTIGTLRAIFEFI